jgi:hypothetical protein
MDVRLTDQQLSKVCNLAPDRPIDAISQAWQFICPEWDGTSKLPVRPAEVTLPYEQWTAIATALAKYGEPLHGVNAVLDWVNYGPGAGLTPSEVQR